MSVCDWEVLPGLIILTNGLFIGLITVTFNYQCIIKSNHDYIYWWILNNPPPPTHTHTHTHTYTHDKTVKWMSTALLWLRTTWMKLWTQNRSPIAHLHGWAMGCLLSVFFIHWGQVTHLCISKLTTIGLDNGLLPGRHQAIIWTNAGILSIGPFRTNFSDIFIKIYTFLFKQMHLKISSRKWWSFCLSLNMLKKIDML